MMWKRVDQGKREITEEEEADSKRREKEKNEIKNKNLIHRLKRKKKM